MYRTRHLFRMYTLYIRRHRNHGRNKSSKRSCFANNTVSKEKTSLLKDTRYFPIEKYRRCCRRRGKRKINTHLASIYPSTATSLTHSRSLSLTLSFSLTHALSFSLALFLYISVSLTRVSVFSPTVPFCFYFYIILTQN